jgi:CheY-like chemotaxis protein
MAATVMIVEDGPDARESLADFLEQQRYAVICAGDGREAIDILAHTWPQVILLDMRMPRMDGWEFLVWMRANPALANVPVIAMSGTDEAPAGSVGFLRKPYRPEGLLSALELALHAGSGVARENADTAELESAGTPCHGSASTGPSTQRRPGSSAA